MIWYPAIYGRRDDADRHWIVGVAIGVSNEIAMEIACGGRYEPRFMNDPDAEATVELVCVRVNPDTLHAVSSAADICSELARAIVKDMNIEALKGL